MDAVVETKTSLGDASVDWARVDWVLLDMDGTILDLAWDSYFWRDLLHERYAAHHGLSLAEARARLQPTFTRTAHTLPWYCVEFWSRETGLDVVSLKQEIRGRIAPLPGAVSFLDRVRASGRALWLATNAHPTVCGMKLEQTGLAGHFHRVISSHPYGAPKEDPRFWQRLQAEHPFDPARALFVDDSKPVLDAARAYGIGQVIGIRHPDRSAPPRPVEGHRSVDALADLQP